MDAPKDTNGTDARFRKARVTVRDIAREAGVSIATVSRAISNDPAIAQDTRNRVLLLASDMGYSPNLFARGLITRRSGIVAVFANNITNPFYPEVMVKLTRRMQDEQLHTMLFTSDENEEVERALPMLRQLNPDVAVILAATMTSKALGNFEDSRTPVILFNLGTDQPVAVTRGNLASFLTLNALFLTPMMWLQGLVDGPALWLGLVLLGPYALGGFIGVRLFRPEAAFLYRSIAYILIGVAGVTGLPIWGG